MFNHLLTIWEFKSLEIHITKTMHTPSLIYILQIHNLSLEVHITKTISESISEKHAQSLIWNLHTNHHPRSVKWWPHKRVEHLNRAYCSQIMDKPALLLHNRSHKKNHDRAEGRGKGKEQISQKNQDRAQGRGKGKEDKGKGRLTVPESGKPRTSGRVPQCCRLKLTLVRWS